MTKSESLFQEAVQYIPGGVNSPVRAYGSVGMTPPFYRQGRRPLRDRRGWKTVYRLHRFLGAYDPGTQPSGSP